MFQSSEERLTGEVESAVIDRTLMGADDGVRPPLWSIDGAAAAVGDGPRDVRGADGTSVRLARVVRERRRSRSLHDVGKISACCRAPPPLTLPVTLAAFLLARPDSAEMQDLARLPFPKHQARPRNLQLCTVEEFQRGVKAKITLELQRR
ncbi:hypothetical protein SKAU_G00271770 [Synaphobranchus kaupii]|uniref:Uncharacterized protein n=1 Tax=Synaphobranchus kaupii TaxID=118154 RepID=A0A9Q1F0G2_SYNKA|nr:hypothetical protein SKAU_G00271770 [Synaphobranchus kaupii]